MDLRSTCARHSLKFSCHRTVEDGHLVARVLLYSLKTTEVFLVSCCVKSLSQVSFVHFVEFLLCFI